MSLFFLTLAHKLLFTKISIYEEVITWSLCSSRDFGVDGGYPGSEAGIAPKERPGTRDGLVVRDGPGAAGAACQRYVRAGCRQ